MVCYVKINLCYTYVYVIFLIIEPTRCTNFSTFFLFWEWNSTCFGQLLCPSSGVFHCTRSSGICHTGLLTACKQDQDGTIAVCTVKNSWWWTGEPSETCWVSFQNKKKFEKLVHLVGFIIRYLSQFTATWMSSLCYTLCLCWNCFPNNFHNLMIY
jgi:hypothetical protein